MVAGRRIKAPEKMTTKGRMVQKDETELNMHIIFVLRITFAADFLCHDSVLPVMGQS